MIEMFIYSKEDAGMKTAKLRDEKEVLDRQQHADIEAQKNLEENLQQLRSREHELDSQEEQMRKRLKNILDTSTKNKDNLADQKKELRVMQDSHRDARFFHSLVFLVLCVVLVMMILRRQAFPSCLGFGRCVLSLQA